MTCSFIVLLFLSFSVFSLTSFSFFFFNDTAPTEIYTLSLHDALPISSVSCRRLSCQNTTATAMYSREPGMIAVADRKSTRLNSSHQIISYAVFCLKKKKKNKKELCERKAHYSIGHLPTSIHILGPSMI